MASAREMRERVQELRAKVITLAGEAMLEHKEEVTGLLINQQEAEHVTGSGKPIKPYSRHYAMLRSEMGKSTVPDYDMTGEMHGSMELTIISDQQYEFNSPAVADNGKLKTDELKIRDGETAFELTEENKKLVYPIIQDTFMEKVNEVLVLD